MQETGRQARIATPASMEGYRVVVSGAVVPPGDAVSGSIGFGCGVAVLGAVVEGLGLESVPSFVSGLPPGVAGSVAGPWVLGLLVVP